MHHQHRTKASLYGAVDEAFQNRSGFGYGEAVKIQVVLDGVATAMQAAQHLSTGTGIGRFHVFGRLGDDKPMPVANEVVKGVYDIPVFMVRLLCRCDTEHLIAYRTIFIGKIVGQNLQVVENDGRGQVVG